jgi:hypothetical protein
MRPSRWSLAVQREPLQSSSLRSVGYDPDTQTLEVEFQQGEIYQYMGVPEFLYRGLVLASSKGKFFNRNVVDRFPCREMKS